MIVYFTIHLVVVFWRKVCMWVPFMRFLLGMPLRLYIIRHAESDRNVALDGALHVDDPSVMEKIGEIADHDVDITSKGEDQSYQVGALLYHDGCIPDVVFHSGYKRTIKTTACLLFACLRKPKVVEDLALRERESGYTHILLKDEVVEYFPYLEKYWKVVGHLMSRPIGGESLIDVIEKRLKPFLTKVFKRYAGKVVWFVTHGRTIQCLRHILDDFTHEEMEQFLNEEGMVNGKPKKKNTPRNVSVTTYLYDPEIGRLKLHAFNQVFWKVE